MSREIKFRVWDVDTKRIISSEEVNSIFLKVQKAVGFPVELTTENGLYMPFYKDVYMQFTGLKDKNGKEIYEGDILMGHSNPKDLCKVVFGEFNVIDVESLETVDKVIGWYTKVIPTDALSKMEPFCFDMPLTDYYIERGEFEVIGYIYENPELLGGKVNG